MLLCYYYVTIIYPYSISPLIPMKNSKRFPQRLAVLCMGLALAISLITLVPNASAAGSQTWWFRDLDRSPAVDGSFYTKYMMKNSTGASDDSVTAGDIVETTLYLVADEVAQYTVGFVGTWTGAIKYAYEGESNTVTLTLGYVTGSSFTAATGATQSFSTIGDYNDHGVDISITPSETFTIPSGSYLALKITSTAYFGTGIWAEGQNSNNPGTYSSRLISPSSDPGYPVPELSTLILMSSGLLVGTAMLIYGNKKTR